MRHRASASDVLQHARTLRARGAAAVATGAVRDDLDPHEAHTVLSAALAWGTQSARKAALERLLSDGAITVVSTPAQNDPDASIRQWARDQLNTDAQSSMFD